MMRPSGLGHATLHLAVTHDLFDATETAGMLTTLTT
jgi:hypothetical protein